LISQRLRMVWWLSEAREDGGRERWKMLINGY
jgi:hypothetical protein